MLFILFLALFNEETLGTTFTFAIRSPELIRSPASTNISAIIPEIFGLINTSSFGTILPVAIVFLMMVSVVGFCV